MPPDRPLLLLPSPGPPVKRDPLKPRFGKVRGPSRERQVERLGPQFSALQQAFEARRVALRTDATGVVPEDVLVITTIGSPQRFFSAVRGVRELEWLGEAALDELSPDEDFYQQDKNGLPTDKPLDGRLLLIFSNQRALDELLRLWRRWSGGDEKLGRGREGWRAVFAAIREIRRWSSTDRLGETGILEDWREREQTGAEWVRTEIELWHRADVAARERAQARVRQLIQKEQGRIIDAQTITEIAYDALLAELPIASVRRVLNAPDDVELVQCEAIQFFRVAGQAIVDVGLGETHVEAADVGATPAAMNPVVALFDGLPLAGHRRLAGRLLIDDPDGFEDDAYEARWRQHGTAMASLIVHGDLNDSPLPLRRPIYVRPILRPTPPGPHGRREERAPYDRLFVDLIHRSVRRLFEGEGGEPAVAPSVKIVNLSIGLPDRPFVGALSPLARLVDFLAVKYQLLFVVSAGNHGHSLHLNAPIDAVMRGAVPTAHLTLRALEEDLRNRRLLSPAEAVNALTVGAAHTDQAAPSMRPRSVDPLPKSALAAVYSAVGGGHQRAVKPEILLPGGRALLIEKLGQPSADGWVDVQRDAAPPGQRAAAPGPQVAALDHAVWTRGTSNAAALATRAGAQIFEALEELHAQPGGHVLDALPRAVLLRTLLVHGAEWGDAERLLRRAGVGGHLVPQRQKPFLARFLGFGLSDPQRVVECTRQRVTAIGGGYLNHDEAHIQRLPLPLSLERRGGTRRVIVTHSWFTPVQGPSLDHWARADLYADLPGIDALVGVGREDVDARTGQRGTVQHQVFSGSRAVVFDGDAVLDVRVSCRSVDGRPLAAPVPYGLAVTVEVAEEIDIDVYAEVRQRLLTAVQVEA